MTARRTYHVGDVSRIARVSVRTLHYYDEIGLLLPTARTDAGYRLYTDEDLLRLQERAAQTAVMMAAVDAALTIVDSHRQGGTMESIFDGFNPAVYETEAQERWGGTDAYTAFLVASIRANADRRA